MSYFIAGSERVCDEDKGFAIQPWTKVRFENTGFILEEKKSDLDGELLDLIAMAKIEYTFAYKLVDGELKIDVHHSSFPFQN